MFDIMTSMEFADCVVAVSTAVARLGHAAVDDTTATELRTLLLDLKTSESQLAAQIGRVTHAADAAGAFIGTGARDTAEWLGKETGTSARRNRNAAELGAAMVRSDVLADAVQTGRISADKASIAVSAAGDEAVDAHLLDTVADLPLNAVRPAVEEWRAATIPTETPTSPTCSATAGISGSRVNPTA